MARSVLYGSSQPSSAVSTQTNQSDAFSIPSQTYKYYNNTQVPLAKTGLEYYSEKFTLPNAYMDYVLADTSISDIRSKLDKTLGKSEKGAQSTFTEYTKKYNRFKMPTINDSFQRGFAHIFFTEITVA